MRLLRTSLVTMAILLVSFASQAQTVPEIAAAHDPADGPLALTLSPSFPVADIDTLRQSADLIVEGMVTRARTHLSSNERSIQTTFTVAVSHVIRDQRSALEAAADVHTVEVTEVGGTLQINGRTIIETDSSGHPLASGDTVVLFLKKVQPQDRSYGIHGGPYGAYQVRDGKVFSYIAENLTRLVRFEGARVDELIAAIQ